MKDFLGKSPFTFSMTAGDVPSWLCGFGSKGGCRRGDTQSKIEFWNPSPRFEICEDLQLGEHDAVGGKKMDGDCPGMARNSSGIGSSGTLQGSFSAVSKPPFANEYSCE